MGGDKEQEGGSGKGHFYFADHETPLHERSWAHIRETWREESSI